jgi:SAM-dependent methyltransferase
LPFPDNLFDLVTAVNTHNFWPDLAADPRGILRILKPGGTLIIIESTYEGGKHDPRNHKYDKLVEINFSSINELHDLFSRAGSSEVQMFESYDRGWMCGIGRKLL